MKRLSKALVLGAAVAATTFASMPAADAGDRWRHGRHHHHRGVDGGDLLAAGAIGLAVGALMGVASEPPAYRTRVYDDPYPRYAEPRRYRSYDPDVVYYNGRGASYGAEPWTAEWYDYCRSRYRSFNARTGTFRGYDGRDHFCVAP